MQKCLKHGKSRSVWWKIPFDYNVYYETGETKDSVMKELDDPLIKMMYGNMFKYYMMDKFMYFMGIEKGWNIPLAEPK